MAGLRLGLAAVLVASLLLVSHRRATFWLGLALAGPALALDWAGLFTASRGLAVAASAATSCFLVLIVVTTGNVLLRAQRVTSDTILGGICVYLLLGMLWMSTYGLVEIVRPGSFLLGGVPLGEAGTELDRFRYAEILYFSFVTLTTVGYGDVTPASAAARSLAVGEAIVGQLYLAIFVARLMGLHLVHASARD